MIQWIRSTAWFAHRAAVCAGAAAIAAAASPARAGDDPHADSVVSYDSGSNPVPGFTVAATAVGPPERFTGEGVFPGVVSCFNPPFAPDEIVSIGVGGHLTVSFDTPVTDDPRNPFGIDLLIFSNGFLIDQKYPSGIAAGAFIDPGGVIEVSADGASWMTIDAALGDGLLPTVGYLDAGPYDEQPGAEESDFTRPVDPAVDPGDFLGLDHQQILALYEGSGGGAGFDIGQVGLASICCVRITNPGDPELDPSIEIDALSDVAPGPDPADFDGDGIVGVTDLLLLLGAWGPCPVPPDPCPFDLDGDGFIGVIDLLDLLGAWTT